MQQGLKTKSDYATKSKLRNPQLSCATMQLTVPPKGGNSVSCISCNGRLQPVEIPFQKLPEAITEADGLGLWIQRVEVLKNGYRLTLARKTETQAELLPTL